MSTDDDWKSLGYRSRKEFEDEKEFVKRAEESMRTLEERGPRSDWKRPMEEFETRKIREEQSSGCLMKGAFAIAIILLFYLLQVLGVFE